MSGREPQSGGLPPRPGHTFQGNHAGENAQVQYGDRYNISRENPLSLLPFATQAPFNSYNRQHEPACLPDTRVDILQEIYDWADGKDKEDEQDKRCIFWLNGLAGTGKSTISRTVAYKYHEQRRLRASFFFSKGGGDVRNASKFFTSIAMQLANNSYVLVVDALDECEGDNDVRKILELLAEARSLKTDVLLHNVPLPIVNHDISLFLEYKLGRTRQEWTLRADWPGEVVLRRLVLHACGLFIWAATACRFINEGKEFAEGRLDEILEGTSFDGTPEQHLDQIYLTVLQRSIPNTFRAAEKLKLYTRQRHILGSIAILLSPLPVASLAKVISTPTTQVTQTLERLQAILDVPKDIASSIRLHHPSFRDFLLSKDRCKEFWVDGKEAHQTLATGCIQLMSQTLKKDICEMHAPGSQASQVDSSWIEKRLPPEVQYACLYWVQHLQRGGSQVHSSEETHRFLQAHLLHWLEALGWMGKISEGIQAILILEAYVSVHESPDLHAFIHDARRFAIYSRSIIEQSPLQSYCSALIFAPEKSIVRETFEECIPSWIERKPKVQAHWSAVLQTLEGHLAPVTSVAFSHNGRQVVSGSNDSTVRLWDAATGAPLQTLKGHLRSVNSVAFSQDSRQVISGSSDGTVRLWDVATGALFQTIKGHLNSVTSVALSPDGRQVISVCGDSIVRLWDVTTGALLQTLKGHSSYVTSVAFSHNGRQFVSGSYDDTVRLWDAATPAPAPIQTLKGHLRTVTSVAFSPNGRQVVSSSDDCTVRIWDAVTAAPLQTLKGHSRTVTSVAFSADGRQVVSGSNDSTVRLWDVAAGVLLQTLKSHSAAVASVAFSPNGRQVVSGSDDSIVQLWDAAPGAPLETVNGHSDFVSSVVFSPDTRQVISCSYDNTVRLWDTATGVLLQTLKGHLSYVTSVAFSHNGRQVVSGSNDSTVRLWDAATGELLQTLKGHVRVSSDSTVGLWDVVAGTPVYVHGGHLRVTSVAFSHNGRQVVSGSNDSTVRLWDVVTGALLQTLDGHLSWVSAVAFSPNGRQIVSGSSDNTVRLWDAATGELLHALNGHSGSVAPVAFSPNGRQVVSRSNDSTVRLWDVATGALLQTLESHSDAVTSVTFSPDGKR
ncbi:hypothetical protein VF21_05831 [Pseudogymnoascus sp. 05NY08]|nr:hypothetical protein VF21_05831 [Pseudogymnoascus sp. 05NY08]